MRSLVFAAQRSAQRSAQRLGRQPLLVSTLLLAAACSYADEADPSLIQDPKRTLQPTAAGSPALTGQIGASSTSAPAASNTAAEPPPETLAFAPELVSQTGLYSDTAARTLAPGVQAFEPAYPLWSDAANKLRWIKLPAGTQVDTSDMDLWKLPVGTKLWKQFEKNGRALETRYMAKYGPSESDWTFLAYQWDATQNEAVAVPKGVDNADGAMHDIPSVASCKQCHNAQPMAALGFSAVQLAHNRPGLTLDSLTTSGQLTTPPTSSLVIPGDPISAQALGYLHGNCGGCHNDRATQNFGVTETKIVFWQSAQQLTSLEQTSTYTHLVTNTGGDLTRLQHGLERMKMRDPITQMPPLGTEIVDTNGVSTVEAWLTQLQAHP
jgi:hypothetical protein